MYSNNDFRSYQELYHAEEKKKKWDWLPGGKNTPEYNHWYYMTHPEKWGITKAGQQAVDAVKKGVNEFVEGTSTDLDDKALAGLKSGYNKAKNAVTSTNAYKTAKKATNNLRAATESMQRRDEANRAADAFGARADRRTEQTNKALNATRAGMGVAKNDRYNSAVRESAANAAMKSAGKASTYGRNASIMRGRESSERSRANQEAANASRYLSRAGEAARDFGGAVVEDIKNLGGSVKSGINNAINNSNTQVDDRLRDVYRTARDGNLRSSGEYLKSAVRQAGREIGEGINRKIDESDTVADNMAREAYRNLREGNTNLAKGYARGAARAAVSDVKNAVGKVNDTVTKLKAAANKAISDSPTLVDDRLRDAYRSAKSGDYKNAANELGRAVGAGSGRAPMDNANGIDRRVRSVNNDGRAPMTNATGIDSNPSTQARPQSDAAAKRASKAISKAYDDAMKAVQEAKERYGEGSLQYIRAVQDAFADAKKAISVSGDALRTKFDGATGTIDSAIDSGLEWLNGTYENMIEPIEYRTKLMRDTENYVGPLEDEERRRK